MPTAPLLGSSLDLPPEELDMALDEHVLERRLTKLRLAGPELSHSRKNNLEAVKRLTGTDPYSTFGIKIVIDYVHSKDLEEDEALKMVANVTKCSQDINYTEGRGYISPSSTLKGLKATANAIKRVASEGGTVTFATGHPGSMIDYYTELAYLVRRLGGRVLDLAKGQIVFQGQDRAHEQ